MRKIIFALLMVSIVNASTYTMLQNKLDSEISRDARDNWLLGTYWGNLKILDTEEISKGKMKAKGTFNTKSEFGTILTRHYTAYFKVVLDDVVITECCWETAFGTRWCIR